MLKVEHIGIAVKSLAESEAVFSKLLGQQSYKVEKVESEGVKTSFFKIGDTKIELLEADGDDSPIKKFIEKRGEGIHHITFEVADIYKEKERLEALGFVVLNEPKPGADNKLICFLHPKSTNEVLVEICQEIKALK